MVSLQNNALFSNGACQVTILHPCRTFIWTCSGIYLVSVCLQIPVALLIAQFSKDGSGEALPLGFSEVVNLFHEFGHLVRE